MFYADAVVSGNNYSLTISPLLGSDAGSYQLALDDGTNVGCAIANSNPAVLNVNPLPSVTSASSGVICSGVAQNYTITSSLSGTTYSWDRATVPGITEAGVSNQSANPITETLTNTTTSPILVTYLISPTASSCPGATFTYTVTVNPVSTVDAVTNQTVCNGDPTNAVTFSSPTSGGSIVYNWTNNTPSIGLAASGTGNIASFTGVNAGSAPVTATITITPSYTNGNTCAGTPVTFTITINPSATVNTTSNQTICNGAPTTAVTFSSPTTGGSIVYNWTNNTPSIGLAASGAGNIASFTAVNGGSAPVTATITVTPFYTNGNTCAGTPVTFTITVNPSATVNTISNQTICNGAPTTAVTFSSPTTGGSIVYNWTNNTPSIGLAASGAGNIASFTAVNVGSAPVTATITVIPSYTNNSVACTATPITFTIIVNPTATVNAVNSQTVCKSIATAAVNFSSPTTGGTIVYNWTNNTPSIGLAASGAGNIASFIATNATTSAVTATITVTPSYTNGSATCTGTPTTFTITVNPTATVTAITNQTVCNNAATTAVTFISPTAFVSWARRCV